MPDKIRIRLYTIAAGPHFNLAPGVHEVNAETGEALIGSGHAERMPEPEIETRTTNQAEVADVAAGPVAVETATAAPQRSQKADDLVAAERAGRAAAEAKEERKNPYDGRLALGRAWTRGFDTYGQEYRAPKQG